MLSLLLLLCATMAVVRGTILPIDAQRPCVATFNGSLAIDLEPLFSWPIVARHIQGNGGVYDYAFDCAGHRTSCGPGVAVCQVSVSNPVSVYYEAGGDPARALWFTQHFNPTPVKSISISYPSSFLRMSTINLKLSPTNLTNPLVGYPEDPIEQYNFDLFLPCNKFIGCGV